MIGTVKFYREENGYGFLVPETGGGKDIFVHVSEIHKSGLKEPLEIGAKAV